MVGAHTDSPCLKVKPRPESHRNGYLQLGVEVYGGALLNPWFDRDLSLAGRVSYLDRNGVRLPRPRGLQGARGRDSQPGHPPGPGSQREPVDKRLRPVCRPCWGRQDKDFDLLTLLRQRLEADAGAEVGQVLDHELVLYDTQPPALVGLEREFIASARLDNLLSCFVGMRALLDARGDAGALLVCNDHEEVGSTTAAGARGPMLTQMLERLLPASRKSGTGPCPAPC